MPETTPPPDPAPAPDSGVPPKKRTRGAVNKAHIQTVDKAEQIALAAQKTAYATALLTRAITAEFVTTLLNDIKTARNEIANAVQSTTTKEGATLSGGVAQANLVHALQEVQAAARQKYFTADPTKLGDYFIGENLDENIPLLRQYTQGIIEKLATDTLPGITEAKVTALGTLLGAMNTALENQESAQSGATSTRGTVEDQLKSITARRMTIQFAADAHWPWHDKHNAAVRKEFQLPKETVFAG